MSDKSKVEKSNSAQRNRVQRLEDWDDARYSILPPHAALDPRLTIAHLRTLILIGRVNTKQGWCAASQQDMAKRTCLAFKTVNEAVRDLVAWHYLDFKNQKQTHESRCYYRIKIDREEGPVMAGTPSTRGPVTTGVSSGDSWSEVRSSAERPIYKARARIRSEDQKTLVRGTKSSSDLKSDGRELEAKLAPLTSARAPGGSKRAKYTIRDSAPEWPAWISYLKDIGRYDIVSDIKLKGYINTVDKMPPVEEVVA